MTQLDICEIFGSVQGEGVQSGTPTVFVRLRKCNLRCIWCDTKYAVQDKGTEMSTQYIVEQVKQLLGYKWVTLTGGEPFFQDVEELVTELVKEHYKIAVETNGTIMPSHLTYHMVNVMTISPKLTNSGMLSNVNREIVSTLCHHYGAQLKFVVDSRGDIIEALEFCADLEKNHGCEVMKHIPIVFQPCAKPEDNTTMLLLQLDGLWNFIKTCQQKRYWDLRVMPQTHRLLYGTTRGI